MDKTKTIRQLSEIRRECLLRICYFEEEILKLQAEIKKIDAEVKDSIDFDRLPGTNSLKNTKRRIPKKGIVIQMAGVMNEESPMTMEEIFEEVKKINPNIVFNSVRCYLTTMPCFECIKKYDPRYDKKGWICHKDMVERRIKVTRE